MLSKLLSAASEVGITDHVVLDHHNFPPFDVHESFTPYAQALYDAVVDGRPDRATRPWVFLSHSHGATGLFGLAKLVGPKVRQWILIGRRALHVELVGELFGVQTAAEVKQKSLHELAQILAEVYMNDALKDGTAHEDDSTWGEAFRETATIVRSQYASPVALCAKGDIEAYLGGPLDALPSTAKIAAPIYAIVSSTESARGETREKTARWAELTSGEFRIDAIPCEHMAMPLNKAIIGLVREALATVVNGTGK